MTQQTATFPNTASVLAIVAGSLMIAAAIIILIVGTFVIPHLSEATFPTTVPSSDRAGFVGGILQGVGLFGLVSGAIVLVSGAMLRSNPGQRSLCGVLILVFSVLSFFWTGGFVIGAILGIVGGILALSWKAPRVQA